MHELFVQIMKHTVSTGITTEDHYKEYFDLNVYPQHVHKSKGNHKRAIFLLGKQLATFGLAPDYVPGTPVQKKPFEKSQEQARKEELLRKPEKQDEIYRTPLPASFEVNVPGGFTATPKSSKYERRRAPTQVEPDNIILTEGGAPVREYHTEAPKEEPFRGTGMVEVKPGVYRKVESKARTNDPLKDRVIDIFYENPDATFDDVFDDVWVRAGKITNANKDLEAAKSIFEELRARSYIPDIRLGKTAMEDLDLMLKNISGDNTTIAKLLFPNLNEDAAIGRFTRYMDAMFPLKGSGLTGYISPGKMEDFLNAKYEETIKPIFKPAETVTPSKEPQHVRTKVISKEDKEVRSNLIKTFLSSRGINGPVEKWALGAAENFSGKDPATNAAQILDVANVKFNLGLTKDEIIKELGANKITVRTNRTSVKRRLESIGISVA